MKKDIRVRTQNGTIIVRANGNGVEFPGQTGDDKFPAAALLGLEELIEAGERVLKAIEACQDAEQELEDARSEIPDMAYIETENDCFDASLSDDEDAIVIGCQRFDFKDARKVIAAIKKNRSRSRK